MWMFEIHTVSRQLGKQTQGRIIRFLSSFPLTVTLCVSLICPKVYWLLCGNAGQEGGKSGGHGIPKVKHQDQPAAGFVF